MRISRTFIIEALPACLTLFTVLMIITSGSAQPAPQTQRQRAVCSLRVEGTTSPQTLEPMVVSAQLDCNSTSNVSIGVNTTHLGKHMSHFTGVQVISNLACQQQAQGWWNASGGTRKSLLAMLYFCGDYDIILLQPSVLNITLTSNSSDWTSAVLAVGGGTVVTVRQGSFVGNSASSTIVAFHNATLAIQDHTVIDHNRGMVRAVIMAIDEASLALRDATFSNNSARLGGGAVSCHHNSTVRIEDCLFYNNTASSFGGALSIACRKATISDVTWQGNRADLGGSVYADAGTTTSLENSRFTANHASTAGGGIFLNSSSAVTAAGCAFNANNAGYGAGLHCASCTVQANRLSFTNNSAAEDGGGLYAMNQAQIDLINSTWHGNTADNGAGIACSTVSAESLRSHATLNISDSTFSNNTAKVYGGACSIEGVLKAKLDSNVWSGNSASWGGAMRFSGPSSSNNSLRASTDNITESGGLEISGSIFSTTTATKGGTAAVSSNNFIDNSAGIYGGAVYLEQLVNALFTNSHIVHNVATFGGGLACKSSGQVTLRHSRLSANSAHSSGDAVNSAQVNGGAVYSDSCELEVLQSSVEACTATSVGGGLFQAGTAKVVIVDSNLSNCVADTGGAVGLQDQATLRVSGSSFWNNTANRFGGVVVAGGQSRSVVKVSNFVSNHAGRDGATLYMTESAEVSVSHNCRFVENSANRGAIAIRNSANLTLSNSSLSNNSANGSGGALVAFDTSVALITAGSIISGNHARTDGSGGGGVYASDNSVVTIDEDTEVHGNAAEYGGGVYAGYSAQVIMKGISVSGNQVTMNGGGVYLDTNARGNLTGCKVTFNVAGSTAFTDSISGGMAGGGLGSSGQTVLSLQDCLVANNRAIGNGGGILLQDTAQLMLAGDTSVTNNRADFGWGGGMSLFSGKFDLRQVTRAVHNNFGQHDVNVQSNVTHLTIVGDTSIHNFAHRIGTNEGLLHVVLNVSGYYGVPCQAVQAQAMLTDGTFLGSNVSDENGLVHLEFEVARSPGVYVISLSSPDAPGVPAANLTLQIRSCIRGEVTPSPIACQPCQQGFFSFDPRQGVCSECPGNGNEATCSGGDAITPKPGYWRSSTDSVQIHRCSNPAACNPASNSALLACASDQMCGTSSTYKDLQCAPGYHGNLCGMCVPGTGAARLFVCRECMRSESTIALYILAVVVLLSLIKLMCHLDRQQHAAASDSGNNESKVPGAQLLRPLLLYSQYMLVVSSMPVEWPASISYPLKVLAWVWAPASPETLSIDCLLPRGTHLPISIQKVLFYICTPLVVLALLLLVEMAQVQYLRRQHKHVAMQVKDLLHSSALVAVFFFYPSILRNLFNMFACIPIDQPAAALYSPAAIGSYWVMDMNQQCFTGYHKAWSLGFGLPCCILVCLGLPLGILVKMLNKKACLTEPTTMQHYGFLYMSYRRPMFGWECVVMTQTMVLVAISVFAARLGVICQVIVMNAALILMEILLLIFNPYANHQASKVMLQGVFCLLLTSYLALTFLPWGILQPSPEYGIIMGCVVLLVNVVYVVSVVWQIIILVNWKQVWKSVKRFCAVRSIELASQMQP